MYVQSKTVVSMMESSADDACPEGSFFFKNFFVSVLFLIHSKKPSEQAPFKEKGDGIGGRSLELLPTSSGYQEVLSMTLCFH